jgi:serine/threonine-protein kinase
MKSTQGQELARSLGNLGTYWTLFFALENPQKCHRAITVSIAPNQCKMLKDWAAESQILRTGDLRISKRLLKRELDKLKPKILLKLESGAASI